MSRNYGLFARALYDHGVLMYRRRSFSDQCRLTPDRRSSPFAHKSFSTSRKASSATSSALVLMPSSSSAAREMVPTLRPRGHRFRHVRQIVFTLRVVRGQVSAIRAGPGIETVEPGLILKITSARGGVTLFDDPLDKRFGVPMILP